MSHEVIIGVERRRRWADEQKPPILMEVGVDGATVAEVARRHDITRQHIYQWRQELRHKGLWPCVLARRCSSRLMHLQITLFIGILPLLNGLADFASTGLTRFCLRRGVNGSIFGWSVVDFFGGAAIFTLLVTMMMAIAAWVHWADGTPLLDLGNLLTDIRANPGDYWWLYITFLTTLLPTLLHAGVALFATVFEMSPGLRTFIVTGLTEGGKGDDPKGRWALRALCLTMTVALMLPIMIFGWIIQYHGLVGTALLDMFEGIACISGMLPSSSPVCI